MRFLIRTLQRLAIFGLGVLSVWLIVDVFDWVDHELPSILALSVTYALAAYVILPYTVRMGLKVLQHRHVPRYTITGDGLPGDPVNLALIGTLDALREGFAKAGWQEADPLSLSSAWRMAKTFVLNQPYPTAPFSTLFLFGRGQDIGFQKAIGDSRASGITYDSGRSPSPTPKRSTITSGSTRTGRKIMRVRSGSAPAQRIPGYR